jgi:hypothetical protein
MKIIMALVATVVLTGCAGFGDNMRRAADSINHGVARAPDVNVNVNR